MLKSAYKGLVRPVLEYMYGSSVWDPPSILLQDELEKVQKRAVRFVTGNYLYDETGLCRMKKKYDWHSRTTKVRISGVQSVSIPTNDLVPPIRHVRNQNQTCYWWHIQMTIIHQDLWSGQLVPSPYKRSELSNRVFCTFSSRKERICKWIPISNNLWEETALVNVSTCTSKGGLKCQRVMICDSSKPMSNNRSLSRLFSFL